AKALADYLELRGRARKRSEREGPIPPDGFRWQKKMATGLKSLQYRLLETLWGTGSPFLALPVEGVLRQVYRGKRNREPIRALLALRGRTDDALGRAGVRLIIDRSNDCLRLTPLD